MPADHALDARWWHRVFAALPKGYAVVEFDVSSVRALGEPQLKLVVDGRGIGVYDWRLEQIAKRHTHERPAADALARAIRRAVRSAAAELQQQPELRQHPGLLRATATGVRIEPAAEPGGPL